MSENSKKTGMQESWGLLQPDGHKDMTAIAIGVAKLGEPAVLLEAAEAGGGFVASGRAPSVAAGRLSYIYGLKVLYSTPSKHKPLDSW